MPHVVLDINKRGVLMCHEKVLLATRVPEQAYLLLYQGMLLAMVPCAKL